MHFVVDELCVCVCVSVCSLFVVSDLVYVANSLEAFCFCIYLNGLCVATHNNALVLGAFDDHCNGENSRVLDSLLLSFLLCH